MPERICIVSFTDPEGIRHSVEVTASSLYEAAVHGLKEFRRSALPDVNRPGRATRLVIAVKAPAAEHEVTVAGVETWLAAGARSPREASLKATLRAMLERSG